MNARYGKEQNHTATSSANAATYAATAPADRRRTRESWSTTIRGSFGLTSQYSGRQRRYQHDPERPRCAAVRARLRGVQRDRSSGAAHRHASSGSASETRRGALPGRRRVDLPASSVRGGTRRPTVAASLSIRLQPAHGAVARGRRDPGDGAVSREQRGRPRLACRSIRSVLAAFSRSPGESASCCWRRGPPSSWRVEVRSAKRAAAQWPSSRSGVWWCSRRAAHGWPVHSAGCSLECRSGSGSPTSFSLRS